MELSELKIASQNDALVNVSGCAILTRRFILFFLLLRKVVVLGLRGQQMLVLLRENAFYERYWLLVLFLLVA